MKNIDSQIEQCKKDLEAIKIKLEKLEAEKKLTKLKFGDIVYFAGEHRAKRVILYDSKHECLAAFGRDGKASGWIDINRWFVSTGKNIFEDNLLDLDL